MSTAGPPTPRAVPFYCPFCGEQDLRPAESSGWHCEICDRTWELSITSIGPGGAEEANA